MTTFLWAYLASWLLFCFTMLIIFFRNPRIYTITDKAYYQFLCVPWKLLTFAIATTGITLIAPYTGDPTWDYIDALFMSILTFVTAPWATGVLYLSIRKKHINKATFLAICLWMFSASWSYDLYLLIRDGYYPNTWFSNILASSVLYCCAGLLWNLDWKTERGMTFSFLEDNWPRVKPETSFHKIFVAASPFMLMVFIIIISFLFPEWYSK